MDPLSIRSTNCDFPLSLPEITPCQVEPTWGPLCILFLLGFCHPLAFQILTITPSGSPLLHSSLQSAIPYDSVSPLIGNHPLLLMFLTESNQSVFAGYSRFFCDVISASLLGVSMSLIDPTKLSQMYRAAALPTHFSFCFSSLLVFPTSTTQLQTYLLGSFSSCFWFSIALIPFKILYTF